MEIEKLIEAVRLCGSTPKVDQCKRCAYWAAGDMSRCIPNMTGEAATALSTLQAENDKLRAELEQKEKYYEQMIDALSATDSADLAQMTDCVYYKPGGLCRYGGDDPANVCVLGPCPHERTAEEVLAALARMTAERDAAVEDLEEIMFKGGHNIDTCHFCTNGQCYGRGGTQVCEPKWRGIKED